MVPGDNSNDELERKKHILKHAKELDYVKLPLIEQRRSASVENTIRPRNYRGGLDKVFTKYVSSTGLVHYHVVWKDGTRSKETPFALAKFVSAIEAYEHERLSNNKSKQGGRRPGRPGRPGRPRRVVAEESTKKRVSSPIVVLSSSDKEDDDEDDDMDELIESSSSISTNGVSDDEDYERGSRRTSRGGRHGGKKRARSPSPRRSGRQRTQRVAGLNLMQLSDSDFMEDEIDSSDDARQRAPKRPAFKPSPKTVLFGPVNKSFSLAHHRKCNKCQSGGHLLNSARVHKDSKDVLLPCFHCAFAVHPGCMSKDAACFIKIPVDKDAEIGESGVENREKTPGSIAASPSSPKERATPEKQGAASISNSSSASPKGINGINGDQHEEEGEKETEKPKPEARYVVVCGECHKDKDYFQAAHLGVCYKCKETAPCDYKDSTTQTTQLLERCTECRRAFHGKCMPGTWKDSDIFERTNEPNTCETCRHFHADVDLILSWEKVASNVEPLEPGLPALDGTYVPPAEETNKIIKFDPKHGAYACLVKWKAQSYRHLSWVPFDWLRRYSRQKATNWIESTTGDHWRSMELVVPRQRAKMDRIMKVQYDSSGHIFTTLANYQGLPYAEVYRDTVPTEEDLKPAFRQAVKRYMMAQKIPPVKSMAEKLKRVKTKYLPEEFGKRRELKEQPKGLAGTLMQHQMEGINWLLYQWERGHSAILADDMGLGKTIQVIIFLRTIFLRDNVYPFMIVVPNSTLTNWVREFEKWAPDMYAVPLGGYKEARDNALNYEIMGKDKQHFSCHVIIMTYESAMSDTGTRIQNKLDMWPCVIVDEGHRLKAQDSKLFRKLEGIKTMNRVLLTGTPLQNRISELMSIMHFLDKSAFENVQELSETYSELTHESVPELHQMLKPYFLRRTKELVLKDLPPKKELIIPVSMTKLQQELYKQAIVKGTHIMAQLKLPRHLMSSAMKENTSKNITINSRNVLMQLRKILNHPYLIPDVEPEDNPDDEQLDDYKKAMVAAGSKLKLLNMMLPKLIKDGHRILIFSTFRIMLDVLEDFMVLMGIKYVRLDGMTKQEDRTAYIDMFNAPDSEYPVFLLTGRAGGVGINLATADTVIIYDSDYNPHIDLQAISRAHRYGQKKRVLILRFVTRTSAEEKILDVAKKKMVLDHLVVDKMDDEDLSANSVESILKFGAKAIFSDKAKEIVYDEAAVDKLLDRDAHFANVEQERVERDERERQDAELAATAEANGEPPAPRNLLSFSTANIWTSATNDKDDDNDTDVVDDANEDQDNDVWLKLLEQGRQEAEKELAQTEVALGRGARKRKVVSYHEAGKRGGGKGKQPATNEELELDMDLMLTDSEDDDFDIEKATKRATDDDDDDDDFEKSRKKMVNEHGEVDNSDSDSETDLQAEEYDEFAAELASSIQAYKRAKEASQNVPLYQAQPSRPSATKPKQKAAHKQQPHYQQPAMTLVPAHHQQQPVIPNGSQMVPGPPMVQNRPRSNGKMSTQAFTSMAMLQQQQQQQQQPMLPHAMPLRPPTIVTARIRDPQGVTERTICPLEPDLREFFKHILTYHHGTEANYSAMLYHLEHTPVTPGDFQRQINVIRTLLNDYHKHIETYGFPKQPAQQQPRPTVSRPTIPQQRPAVPQQRPTVPQPPEPSPQRPPPPMRTPQQQQILFQQQQLQQHQQQLHSLQHQHQHLATGRPPMHMVQRPPPPPPPYQPNAMLDGPIMHVPPTHVRQQQQQSPPHPQYRIQYDQRTGQTISHPQQRPPPSA
ncbi:hypothetical protein BC940DRAFT_311628 [Gongronella butleri]|nr:hypothetical protein BC940DRAFT_311628 [Gongronella butleri]